MKPSPSNAWQVPGLGLLQAHAVDEAEGAGTSKGTHTSISPYLESRWPI